MLAVYVVAFVGLLVFYPRVVVGVVAGAALAVGLMVRAAREEPAAMRWCWQCGKEHAGYPEGVCPFKAGLTGGPRGETTRKEEAGEVPTTV
jgi:hypothetical protein